MSIMTSRENTNLDQLYFLLEYPSTEQAIDFIKKVEEKLCVQGLRDGFLLSITGSCNKGPQGINWFILIEAETSAQMDIVREILKGMKHATR